MIWTSVDSEAEGQQQQKSIILLNKKTKTFWPSSVQ